MKRGDEGGLIFLLVLLYSNCTVPGTQVYVYGIRVLTFNCIDDDQTSVQVVRLVRLVHVRVLHTY